MRSRALHLIAFVMLVAAATTALEAQTVAVAATAERLQPTTAADAARMHVMLGLDERIHPFLLRARRHFDEALALDAQLPLALAGKAVLEPGLTVAQRIEGVERALAAQPSASAAEQALMLAWREQLAGRTANALALYRVAEELAPGEPAIAVEHAIRHPAGAERIAALRSVLERFPDYGPAHNYISYQLYFAGDKEAGLHHVREYVRLSPDHPNAHDSYGEVMAWERQIDEAERAYRRALELDPEFDEARYGIAEVMLARGRYDEAREIWTEARDAAPTPAERRTFDYALVMAHLFEGDARDAQRELERIAEEAAAADAPGAARTALWLAAAVAAHRDDRAGASRLMARAAEQPGTADASLPVRRVLAAPRDVELIRSTIAELEAARTAPDAPARYADDLRVLRALEAARSGDFARAEALALEMPGVSGQQFVLGFVAEAMNAAGRRADARRVRDLILSRPEFTLNGAFARAKVSGIR